MDVDTFVKSIVCRIYPFILPLPAGVLPGIQHVGRPLKNVRGIFPLRRAHAVTELPPQITK
jgi:hypothetical protein